MSHQHLELKYLHVRAFGSTVTVEAQVKPTTACLRASASALLSAQLLLHLLGNPILEEEAQGTHV